jgi:hypothetical protein
MVIFVVMGLVAMGWAANIVITRHGRLNETI